MIKQYRVQTRDCDDYVLDDVVVYDLKIACQMAEMFLQSDDRCQVRLTKESKLGAEYDD